MADREQKRETICEAALGLAGERGWAELSLRDIAIRADLSLADVYEVTSSKFDVLVAIEQHFSALLCSETAPHDEADTIRDRIFDVVMLSLETLEPHRRGVEAIYRAVLRDPLTLLLLTPTFRRAMTTLLNAAALETDGLKGRVTADGLGLIWLNTFRIWLDDDAAELAKTMAGLDKSLRRLEGAYNTVSTCSLPSVFNLGASVFSR